MTDTSLDSKWVFSNDQINTNCSGTALCSRVNIDLLVVIQVILCTPGLGVYGCCVIGPAGYVVHTWVRYLWLLCYWSCGVMLCIPGLDICGCYVTSPAVSCCASLG
jgi:hypothetical protein